MNNIGRRGGCLLPFGIILVILSLAGCAPLLVGGVAGVGVYRYNKCEKWVDTPYGQKRVWTCKHYLHGD